MKVSIQIKEDEILLFLNEKVKSDMFSVFRMKLNRLGFSYDFERKVNYIKTKTPSVVINEIKKEFVVLNLENEKNKEEEKKEKKKFTFSELAREFGL